jgi:nitrogen fixation protein NifU and related proteins
MNEMETHLRERLRGIYSETTIEHIIHPHNTHGIANPDGYAALDTGDGETIKIWLRIRNDFVEDAAFWTSGCAATIACGSMSTDLAIGRSVIKALAVTAQNIADALVDLPPGNYHCVPPGNYHCAELAADALRAALKDYLSIQQQPWKKLYRK